MMRPFLAICAIFLLAGAIAEARADVFNPTSFTLDNGMEVVVLPNHRAPVVLHMVWYKAGSADEPKGKSGVAHLLEHLMFKGTAKNPDGAFSRILAQHGGQENAFTTYDYTGYHQTVAADRLGMVMELEADRMSNLAMDAADVATERDVVLEERNQRIENNPGARLRVEAQQKLYPKDHPYSRPIIGWRDEVAALTREDVLAFYKEHYAPNNAILVVAGDVNVDDVRRLAQKHYGVIAPAKLAPRPSLVVNGAIEGGETVLKDARVPQPGWTQTVLQPSYTNGDVKRVVALELLGEVLGGGATSRLYRKLVIDQPMAVSVGAYYNSGARGDGTFMFHATPQPGVDVDALADAVRAEAQRLLDEGFEQGELDRIKKRMISSAVFARDEMKSGAYTIGSARAAGHSLMTVEDWPDHIREIREQDVLDALAQVLTDPRRITTKLLPDEGRGS
jgi:zinc protease